MIEVFNRDENGKDRLIATSATYADLFSHVTEADLKAFGHTEAQRTNAPRILDDRDRYYLGWADHPSRYCYIAFDDGFPVSPDRLVGLFRAWRRGLPSYRRRAWTHKAWGRYRRIRTTQERRWSRAHDGEPDAPRVRSSRSLRGLPDAWDDRAAHNDRSWKTQSRRPHQWKEAR